MAKILFMAISNTNDDPIRDAAGCYKFGDPVVVLPSTHTFGSGEGLPTFFQVDCPDASEVDIRYLLEPLTEQEGVDDNEPETLIRKRYGFDLNSLPDQYKNKLCGIGKVEVPFYILKRVLTYKA